MDKYDGQVAVITGAANGVGRALALALGKRGAKVVVSDVNREGLAETSELLAELGADNHNVFCDVADLASCEELAEKSFSHFGRVDYVFANAGIAAGETGPMWNYSLNDWNWAFNVNVWGVVNSINAFVQRLIDQGTEAHFVITGSGNGAFLIMPGQPIYTASKAAVQAITENLYYQLKAADSNVQVHGLYPGPYPVETGIVNSEEARPDGLEREADKPVSQLRSREAIREMMADMGREYITMSADEVAENALEELAKNQLFLAWMTPQTEQLVRNRTECIVTQTDFPVIKF